MAYAIGPQLLDGCVLAVLSHGDAYGYILTQQVKGKLDISESTLYPVLRRLQKEGYLDVYDQEFAGRNRRYYRITPKGGVLLEESLEEWENFKSRLGRVFYSQQTPRDQG